MDSTDKTKVQDIKYKDAKIKDPKAGKVNKDFNPEYNDKGEYQGPMTQWSQKEKRQYIKGRLTNLGVEFYRITMDEEGNVMVQISSNWCEENGYKCGKDGKIDPKFVKMLNDNDVKTDTISFTVRNTQEKENPQVVYSLESFQSFDKSVNEAIPTNAKRLYRKTRADGAYIKRSKFSILTLAEKELAFDPEFLEAVYNNGGVWIDQEELIPYIMPKDQKPNVESVKWLTCDGSGPSRSSRDIATALEEVTDLSQLLGGGGGVKKRTDILTGEEFWSVGSGHRLSTAGRMVQYRRTHYVPRGGMKYREKDVPEELVVQKGDRVKIIVTDKDIVTTETGDIVSNGEYEGVARHDSISGEVEVMTKGSKYDKEIMYVPLNAIELIV